MIGSLLKLLAPSTPKPENRLAPERIQGADFASLLSAARAGEISSGLPVKNTVKGLNLSEDQLQRLAAAADQAQAQGATRALVLIDGMALKLDITMREITGTADMNSPGVFTNIDAVVTMPSAKAKPETLPLPHANPGLQNPSLLKLLSQSNTAA